MFFMMGITDGRKDFEPMFRMKYARETPVVRSRSDLGDEVF